MSRQREQHFRGSFPEPQAINYLERGRTMRRADAFEARPVEMGDANRSDDGRHLPVRIWQLE